MRNVFTNGFNPYAYECVQFQCKRYWDPKYVYSALKLVTY